MRRVVLLRWASLLLPLLGACGADPVARGGSGTDSGNALTVVVLAPDGTRVSGAVVEVRPADGVPADSADAPVATALSDGGGVATFHLAAGNWSVLARTDSLVGWATSVATPSVSGVLGAPASVRGELRGASGLRVGLRGLGRSVVCDSFGQFTLEGLPAGALRLVVVRAASVDTAVLPLSPGSNVTFSAAIDSLPSTLDTATVQPDTPPRTESDH